MTAVALDGVGKVFPDGTVAVDNVSLEVSSGEFMVMLGPSGCGKSTVLRMIAGLEQPTSGTVLLDGEEVDYLLPHERGVAMVFQNYALYPHMSVGANIGFPLQLAKVDPADQADQVATVAAALGIGDLLDRRPGRLSGGQQQRAAMGRAIVRRPRLFLMDEPLSNLDAGLRTELRAEISNLVRGLGATCIYVTHDQTEALTMADRVAIMRNGSLQDVGTPGDVYTRPANAYVAAFLGNPRMCLAEAEVYVHLDRCVMLRFGEQSLELPWKDPMVWALSHYHGDRITVGMRPEALVPARADETGPRLRGRIRYLEHHGHETLAFLDVGALAVDPVEPASAAASAAPTTLRRLVGRFAGRMRVAPPGEANPAGRAPVVARDARSSGFPAVPQYPQVSGGGGLRAERAIAAPPRGAAAALPDAGTGAERRRHGRRSADLAVRTAPYLPLAPGEVLEVVVRPHLLHLFDSRGKRIDGGWR